MPRYPLLAASAEAMPASIFTRLLEHLERFDGPVIPFQIGDTYLSPPLAARLSSIRFGATDESDLYRYGKAHGGPELLEAVTNKVRAKNGMDWVSRHNVQITSGATNALSCAMRAVTNPGDEILLLAPYWPLIRGIAVSAEVHPTEVDGSRSAVAERGISAIIEGGISERTVALYISSPSNPDGRVLDRAALEQIREVAIRHNLWVISDEVYEDFVFDGGQHISIAILPGMAARTLTAFSFSKSYGLAGLRVGYLVGPAGAVGAARKMVGHTIYNVPAAMQRAALKALIGGDEFLIEARTVYQEARDVALDQIVAPCHKPSGATYLFLDLRQWADPDGGCAHNVLAKIAESGVLLTPGGAFGNAYSQWARMCFTSVPRPVLLEGIRRINAVLASIECS